MTTTWELERQIEQIVAAHVAALRKAAQGAVERAFAAASASAPTVAPSRPRAARAASKRRAGPELSALGERFFEALSRKPGETMGVLSAEVGASPLRWRRVGNGSTNLLTFSGGISSRLLPRWPGWPPRLRACRAFFSRFLRFCPSAAPPHGQTFRVRVDVQQCGQRRPPCQSGATKWGRACFRPSRNGTASGATISASADSPATSSKTATNIAGANKRSGSVEFYGGKPDCREVELKLDDGAR